MSHHGRRGKRGGSRSYREPKQPRGESNVDESSEIIQQFLGYQKRLDSKHDKHERLVKLSRDVTIDSKRTIFVLQRLTGQEEERERILREAEDKLGELQRTKWRAICVELEGEDPYQYLRAYSPGMQEYIEAISFLYYLKHEQLIPLDTVQQSLIFPRKETEEVKNTGTSDESQPASQPCDVTDQSADSIQSPDQKAQPIAEQPEASSSQSGTSLNSPDHMSVHIPPMEYVLGIADLTGELMRVAITSVGSGDLDKPFKLCNFLRGVYDHILIIGNVNRELNRKVYTLKQSLQKVEAACYALQVRGSEVPKHMLADMMKFVGNHQDDPGSGDIEAV